MFSGPHFSLDTVFNKGSLDSPNPPRTKTTTSKVSDGRKALSHASLAVLSARRIDALPALNRS